MAVLPNVLQPSMVSGRISQLKVINDTLQRDFNAGAGGSSERPVPIRRGAYDIFNDSRWVPSARLPAATSGTVARKPVGSVAYTIPRSADKIPLLMEELNQLRLLGGPTSQNDDLGTVYIAAQEKVFRQELVNLREFQIAAMLRGSYTYSPTGDDLLHAFSGGNHTVDFQIPSGNKTALNMLGGGSIIGTSWDNAAAPIVSNLFSINAAFMQLTGRGLRTMRCTSVLWGYILNNIQVQNQAGSVNQVFDYINRNEEREDFTARLKAVPWLQIHITDNGLNLGTGTGTFTKLIADTMAIFHTSIDTDVFEYMITCEPVSERPGTAPHNVFGDYYYWNVSDDPVSYILNRRANGLPMLKVPSCIAPATVVF